MADVSASARAASASSATRPASVAGAGRLTRPDAASRVAETEERFATFAAAALELAEPIQPVSPITPFRSSGDPSGNDEQRGAFGDADDQSVAGGRRLLSGSLPILLAETRLVEDRVLASDPGQSDVTRAINQYKDTALALTRSGRQVAIDSP